MGTRTDVALAWLNGLLGHHLQRTGNGLSTPMELYRRDGSPVATPLAATPEGVTQSTRWVVLVHGLMSNEQVWRMPDGSDYGSRLEEQRGFLPLYLRYNSGRAVEENGMELAQLLDRLQCSVGDVQEILLIGYSMGGLLLRAAYRAAENAHHAWLSRVRRAIYLGTPHLGAPAERFGRLTTRVLRVIDDPYTRLVATIAALRSDGIQNLGDPAGPMPLLQSIEHHLIAGTLFSGPLAALLGDSVVPVRSATRLVVSELTEPDLPANRVTVLPRMSHLALARDPRVYEQISAICGEPS